MYLRRRTPSFSVSLKNHRRILCSHSPLYPGNATVLSNKRRTDHSTKNLFYWKAYSHNDSVHLTVDTGSSSEEAVCDARIARRRKLNAFLEECNVMPLNQKPMLPWEEASERTRERYVARTSEIRTAVLNTVSEENAACLWNALQGLRLIPTALGIDTTHPLENAYLEALVEAYKNMSGWDTKRQVLSVMSGVALFAAIKKFIPELNRYRYHMATTHS